jgi:hypothetical protein
MLTKYRSKRGSDIAPQNIILKDESINGFNESLILVMYFKGIIKKLLILPVYCVADWNQTRIRFYTNSDLSNPGSEKGGLL